MKVLLVDDMATVRMLYGRLLENQGYEVVQASSITEAVEKALEGDDYDMAIVAALWGPPALTDELPETVAGSVAFFEKPVIICTPGGEYSRKRMGLWRRHGLPVFMSPEEAVRAAAVLSRGAKTGRTEPEQE